MLDDRKLKILVFNTGKMDGCNERGLPHSDWLDEIVNWCAKGVQELSHYDLVIYRIS